MTKPIKLFLLVFIVCVLCWGSLCFSAESTQFKLTKTKGVSTYNSIGIYANYVGDSNSNSICKVRYRKTGAKWMQGMDLIPDRKDSQFRGSLLMLEPNTVYEIELIAEDPDSGTQKLTLTTETWDDPKAFEYRYLPVQSKKQLAINDKGTPSKWIVYQPSQGKEALIDAGTSSNEAVLIKNAEYVVLERLTAHGGSNHCINIFNSHHIIIRRCEISEWGKRGVVGPDGRYVDEKGRFINEQAGISVGRGCSNVIVEDNYIHSPLATARSWRYGHPKGPDGVIFRYTSGNNVVRNNEIIGDEEHWWMDGINSGSSYVSSGPYRDTDIYGNCVLFVNDDCIELDGGQINVRCWDNRVETGISSLSLAPCVKGPAYIFRNLFVHIGDDRGLTGCVFKTGDGDGLDLIMHNTVYGTGTGIRSARYRMFSRNNLFAGPLHAGGEMDIDDRNKNPKSDFDYDLLSRQGANVAEGNEKHAVKEAPVFIDSFAGDFRLTKNSPGIDAGIFIPGVNGGFTGKAPEMGAFETESDGVIPYRKSGMMTRPQRIELKGEFGTGMSESAEIELIVPKKAGNNWRACPNSPWIMCKPASGSSNNTPQKVKITCKTDNLSNRLYRGAVTFRTDHGLNRTITLHLRIYPKPYYAKHIEAEAGEPSGDFKTVNEESASGKKYVSAIGRNGKLTFKFEVPSDGIYYVAARCITPVPCGSHNSFHFSMDGEEQSRWNVFASPYQWSWSMLNKWEQDATASLAHPFKLTKGEHLLTINVREPDTRLDSIVITNNPYPYPHNEGIIPQK